MRKYLRIRYGFSTYLQEPQKAVTAALKDPYVSVTVRRTWPVERRKEFALRLYQCIHQRYQEAADRQTSSAYVWFTSRLEAKTRTRESTIRKWIPPRRFLDLDIARGSHVRKRDWKALATPDLPTLCDVADVLDVSIDYLQGREVPVRITDREPVGELGAALRHFLLAELQRLPDWRDADVKSAADALPHGASLLRRAARLVISDIADTVEIQRKADLQAVLRKLEEYQGFRVKRLADIEERMIANITRPVLAEVERLSAPLSLPSIDS